MKTKRIAIYAAAVITLCAIIATGFASACLTTCSGINISNGSTISPSNVVGHQNGSYGQIICTGTGDGGHFQGSLPAQSAGKTVQSTAYASVANKASFYLSVQQNSGSAKQVVSTSLSTSPTLYIGSNPNIAFNTGTATGQSTSGAVTIYVDSIDVK